jgi:hypothetical protein
MHSVRDQDDDLEYKALHTGALIALVLGILSVCVWFAAVNSLQSSLMVAPIPVAGMFLALRSMARIRQYPDQYTGLQVAAVGLILSIVFLVTGVGYGAYVYATEVPEGYTRISFIGMKPDELEERAGEIVSRDVMALDGQKVFIKGYIRPDSITVPNGIDRFLLVRDNNQCCFGDLSKIKYYDQIDVKMSGAERVDYTQGVFRIGGILHVEPRNALPGSQNPVFTLTADYAKY